MTSSREDNGHWLLLKTKFNQVNVRIYLALLNDSQVRRQPLWQVDTPPRLQGVFKCKRAFKKKKPPAESLARNELLDRKGT